MSKKQAKLPIKKKKTSHKNLARRVLTPDFFPGQQSVAVYSAILGHPLVPGCTHMCVRACVHARPVTLACPTLRVARVTCSVWVSSSMLSADPGLPSFDEKNLHGATERFTKPEFFQRKSGQSDSYVKLLSGLRLLINTS